MKNKDKFNIFRLKIMQPLAIKIFFFNFINKVV